MPLEGTSNNILFEKVKRKKKTYANVANRDKLK